jgi:hypothetical protein
MIPDLDIYRSANLLVKQHGEDAPNHAAMRADAMLEAGDLDGHRVWKRILRAVKELGDAKAMSETPALTAPEIAQLARFDEHWRVLLAGDNRLLAQALAKRGYLDVLKRRVPLYRLSDLGRKAARVTLPAR